MPLQTLQSMGIYVYGRSWVIKKPMGIDTIPVKKVSGATERKVREERKKGDTDHPN